MPYIRDKRSPAPKSEAVSRVMSANRAKDSKPELILRHALRSAGHRGYRLHYRISLKSSPPYQGGVAATASGTDGVVLTQPGTPDLKADSTKNYPVVETPPPLLRKEGSLNAGTKSSPPYQGGVDPDERQRVGRRGGSLSVRPDTKGSPPYQGGVAVPASGTDGVVLTQPGTPDLKADSTKNYPVVETPPPLLRKEGSLNAGTKSSPPYQAGVDPDERQRVGRRGGSLSVRPDITFVGRRLAIFVHGCFWHRCPRCNYALPKNNTEFWQAKFDRNVTRDAQKTSALKRLGWKVITSLHLDGF